MLDINSSIQKNGTLSVQNSDGTLKQVAYLSATISESGTVSMSASFNDFAAYLANDIALDSELKSFLDGVKILTRQHTAQKITQLVQMQQEQ